MYPSPYSRWKLSVNNDISPLISEAGGRSPDGRGSTTTAGDDEGLTPVSTFPFVEDFTKGVLLKDLRAGTLVEGVELNASFASG